MDWCRRMKNKLSTQALELALAALQRSIEASAPLLTDKAVSSAIQETLRAGVIQHFEFCYELAWKTLKRYLEVGASDKALLDTMSYQELIREGAVKGLIANAENWLQYRHKRNQTSHSYHAEIAENVYNATITFYQDAMDLLIKLQKR